MKHVVFKLKDNSGAASILVVLLMIVFITLGLLAMVFANSNYKLAQKTADNEQTYYALDSDAEVVLAEIDSLLIPIAKAAGNDTDEYIPLSTNTLIEWINNHPEYQGKYVSEKALSSLPQEKPPDYCFLTIGIDQQYLEIGIAPLDPALNQGKRYDIVLWQKKNTSFNYDEEIIID